MDWKQDGGEKEVWHFEPWCLVSLSRLGPNVLQSLFKEVYPFFDSNHNEYSKQKRPSFLTTAKPLRETRERLRTVSRSTDSVPLPAKPHHQIRRGAVLCPRQYTRNQGSIVSMWFKLTKQTKDKTLCNCGSFIAATFTFRILHVSYTFSFGLEDHNGEFWEGRERSQNLIVFTLVITGEEENEGRQAGQWSGIS